MVEEEEEMVEEEEEMVEEEEDLVVEEEKVLDFVTTTLFCFELGTDALGRMSGVVVVAPTLTPKLCAGITEP